MSEKAEVKATEDIWKLGEGMVCEAAAERKSQDNGRQPKRWQQHRYTKLK